MANPNAVPPQRGRPKGVRNKTTVALKEAILKAAKKVGEDGSGLGGLEGYLRHLAAKDSKTFGSLLGKVLPLTIAGTGKDGAIVTDSTVTTRIEIVTVPASHFLPAPVNENAPGLLGNVVAAGDRDDEESAA